MTTLAVGQSILPVGWPTDDLYHSPIGLFDFQAEGIADAYFSILSGGGRMICWDTGCIQGDADIVINRGGCARHYPLSEVVRMFNGGLAKNGRAWDLSIPTMVQREVDGEIRLAEIANAWESGVKTTYTVTTAGGRSIRATDEHPFLTERGWLRLDELVVGDLLHTRGEKAAGQPKKAKPLYREVMIKVDLDPVVSIERYGEEMTYDIEVVGEPHNFVANGIVVHNTGKALRNDQRVVTPSGWRAIGDIQPGDPIVGSDGQTHKVVSVHPQGVRPLYRVTTSDGIEIIADSEHLWNVNTRLRCSRKMPFKTMSTTEILEAGLRDKDGYRHYLPIVDPIDLPERDLPLDPYLLGVILGDGTLREPTIKITSADNIIEHITLPEGVTARPLYNGSRGVTEGWALITRNKPNPLLDAVRAMGLHGHKSETKFVPTEYLWASVSQRLALLQGLMDTDGSVDQRQGALEFSSTSRALADAVKHLVLSLGGTAKIVARQTSYPYKGEKRLGLVSYRVSIGWSYTQPPFRLARKASLVRPRQRRIVRAIASIESVKPAEATCIVVDAPDSLFLTEGLTLTHNSHGGMRLSTLLAEDARAGEAKHDLTMLVCEKGKVSEWAEDFARFTRQSTRIHHGPNRMKKLISEPLPDVLITTYETAKADLVKFVKVPGKRGTSIQVGPLLEKIEPLSVLWVCDEFGKLRNRSAGNYKAFEFTFRQMKKSHPNEHRVVGLTATPIERDWEDAFNQCRLLRPELMPTVADFEKHFVRARDPFGRARYRPEVTTDFVEMCRPIILRKRKTDPDVVAQFPRKVEEAKHLEMAPDQAHLYETVESMQYGQEEPVPGLWTVLRQIAASPASLVRSASHGSSVLASALVSELGAEYLQSISSVKEQALLDYLDPLVNGQGAKVVVFTFFGQSVLPILGELLRSKGFRVYENHGGLSSAEMGEVRRSFKVDPAPCVFLTSDAGSRGINLPEATYVCVAADTPVLTDDLRWVPAGSLQAGDGVVGCDEMPTGPGRTGARRWQLGTVVRNEVQPRECLRVHLSNGESLVVTPEHRMLIRGGKGVRWERADRLKPCHKVLRYFDVWEPDTSYDAGWLAGIYDGEGWFCKSSRGAVLGIAQNPGLVLDRIRALVTDAKFQVREHGHPDPNPIRRFHVTGGRAEQTRFLGIYRPVRLIQNWRKIISNYLAAAIEHVSVLSVEPAGVHDVAIMETSTKTFVGAGYMHHNCEYESALTYANRTQRLDRIHRIDSDAPSVTCMTFVVNHSVEVKIMEVMSQRNEQSDILLDDSDAGEEFLGAADRRVALQMSRLSKKRAGGAPPKEPSSRLVT